MIHSLVWCNAGFSYTKDDILSNQGDRDFTVNLIPCMCDGSAIHTYVAMWFTTTSLVANKQVSLHVCYKLVAAFVWYVIRNLEQYCISDIRIWKQAEITDILIPEIAMALSWCN